MSSRTISRVLPLMIALISFIGDSSAYGQSVACGGPPLLGSAGPEICVSVTETDVAGTRIGGPVYFRGPAVPGGALPIPGLTLANYNVGLTVGYASGPIGMALAMTGTVTKTSAEKTRLSIVANAGWGAPLPAGSGTLTLVGSASGTSQVTLGGAAGFPFGMTPAEDLQYVGFNQSIDVTTLDAGSFSDGPLVQAVDSGAVAVQMHMTFHLNEANDFITIPGGVGLAPEGETPPTPDMTGFGGPSHFECYNIDELDPKESHGDVTLADQFAKVKTKVGEITRICAPVDKNGEGIPEPRWHLVCYEILDGHDPDRLVETTNQFGRTKMQVREALDLCVPSTKRLLESEKK